ncbi:MAG: response regulator [Bacteroidota bacterium]|nr:response regulator [Bacteroidota bacterium]
MKKLSILIIEDNSFISEDIAGLLIDVGYEVSGQAYDYEEAIDLLKTKKPDLVLLDINLESDKNGIDIANHINKNEQLPFIYITSHSDTSTLKKINETNPYGYLLKPFDDKALQANIELAWHKFNNEHKELIQKKLSDSIFVKVKQSLVKITINDINYAEAYDNYCYIKTASQKYLVSQTLKSVEEKLMDSGFLRVHRGYLINVTKIQSVTENVVFVDDVPIPVGRSFKDDLLSLLNTL